MPTAITAKTLADVFGPKVGTCSRQSFDSVTTGMRVRDAQEMLSAPPVALGGSAPVICSAGAATTELLALFRAQGMPVASQLLTYRTETEFDQQFAALIADGWRISAEYPQSTRVLPSESALNPAALVSYLNNKGSLAELASPEFTPKRTVGTRAEIEPLLRRDQAWVVKAATDKANGGGFDIWLHQKEEPIQRPDFFVEEDTLVFEEHLTLTHNWSVQQYIDPNGIPHMFGQTEQRIGPTGLFQGNRLGAIGPLAPEFVLECQAIAARAAQKGYRGFCAFDGGQTDDGRIVIFDLNFRISSPSCPLLFFTGHRPELLAGVIETARWNVPDPLSEALRVLRPAIDAGQLLITSAHDARYIDDTSIKRTSLFVSVLGADAGEATRRRLALEATLNLMA